MKNRKLSIGVTRLIPISKVRGRKREVSQAQSFFYNAEWSSWLARESHKLKVVGSSPTSATTLMSRSRTKVLQMPDACVLLSSSQERLKDGKIHSIWHCSIAANVPDCLSGYRGFESHQCRHVGEWCNRQTREIQVLVEQSVRVQVPLLLPPRFFLVGSRFPRQEVKLPRLNINSTYTTTGTLCDMWLRGKDVNKKQSKVKIIKRIQQSITWLKEDSIKIN